MQLSPGNATAWHAMWTAHGRLPWPELFAPAIRAAAEGFAVSPRLAQFIGSAFDEFAAPAKAVYGRDGRPLPEPPIRGAKVKRAVSGAADPRGEGEARGL